jgi:hypothetical protein
MRLNEFDISQAVQFHNELNPALWRGPDLDPVVRKHLLEIAQDFQEFIGVGIYDLLDITISGSNAAYTYTPNSDIDLHLVVTLPDAHDQELRELFDAKKYQYNAQYDFKIRGFDVEVYVQDAEQPHHSMGIYSILRESWIRQPKPQAATVDDDSVKNKFDCYRGRINQALKTTDMLVCRKLWNSIRDMRKSGLARTGEFGVENLTFKMLRAEGLLEKIKDHMVNIKTQEFSLEGRT